MVMFALNVQKLVAESAVVIYMKSVCTYNPQIVDHLIYQLGLKLVVAFVEGKAVVFMSV